LGVRSTVGAGSGVGEVVSVGDGVDSTVGIGVISKIGVDVGVGVMVSVGVAKMGRVGDGSWRGAPLHPDKVTATKKTFKGRSTFMGNKG